MMEIKWRPPLLVERIGSALHKTFDEIRYEPLPERWTELIDRLNAEEEREGELGDFNRAGESPKPSPVTRCL